MGNLPYKAVTSFWKKYLNFFLVSKVSIIFMNKFSHTRCAQVISRRLFFYGYAMNYQPE